MFSKIYYDDTVNDPGNIKVNDELCNDRFVKLIVEKRTNYYKYDEFIEKL